MAFTLRSPHFSHMGEIPPLYTGEGKDISPALIWSDPPEGVGSYALIVDDPDAPDPKAPRITWVHWILYNIPANVHSLKEGILPEELPKGTLVGITNNQKPGYGGPMPPIGRHRYYFKLYALDQEMKGLQSPSKKELEKAMEGHILAKAELMGTYEKQK